MCNEAILVPEVGMELRGAGASWIMYPGSGTACLRLAVACGWVRRSEAEGP